MALSSDDLEAWKAYFKLLDKIDKDSKAANEVYYEEQDSGCGGL